MRWRPTDRSVGMTVFALATGRSPFDSREGYFGIVNRLKNEPAPKLSPDKCVTAASTCCQFLRFSAEICSFLECCLHKDPANRWTAAQLLGHPFIAAALPDAVCPFRRQWCTCAA